MLYLHGIGHFHPENRIDNQFLLELDIGVDPGWVEERVGIRCRRTVLSLDYIRQTRNRDPRAAAEASRYTNSQTAGQAARMALQRAGVSPEQVGLVIAGGCSPQWLVPAEACTIAAELGITAPAFDVNSACSSFITQLHLLEQMRESLPDFVLAVNPENTTRSIDYNDRRHAVVWGDGSAAAVLSARVPSTCSIHPAELKSDPAQWSRVTIRPGGFFDQDGSAVQAFAVRRMATTFSTMRAAGDLENKHFFFIGHQANLRVLERVCRRANLSTARHLYNVDLFGNCGAAGAPSVISQRWEQFKPGDAVAICVVGAGLTWGGVWLKFGDASSSIDASHIHTRALSRQNEMAFVHSRSLPTLPLAQRRSHASL
jgi:3-oxoacyl-[acyl-carrier-protein] synthase III